MGNNTSQSESHFNNIQVRDLNEKYSETTTQNSLVKPTPSIHLKVLPDQNFRKKLRQTDNGEILQSGGTLSGRNQSPQFGNANVTCRLSQQRHSFYKTGLQKSLKTQNKSFQSEPDLRINVSNDTMQERRTKKKYRAPPPPILHMQSKRPPSHWVDNFQGECVNRRTRLFKTRAETKKESNQSLKSEQPVEDYNFLSLEGEKIFKNIKENSRPVRYSMLEFNSAEATLFQKELREATDRFRNSKIQEKDNVQPSNTIFNTAEDLIKEDPLVNPNQDLDDVCTRGEPSGKESSTPETSPDLGDTEPSQKPKIFYFGMEHKDSEELSNYILEDGEDNAAIALQLRPVLPRKPPEIPRFSPAIAWKLLDAQLDDWDVSSDILPLVPRSTSLSWTPQQDLADDSSLEECGNEIIQPQKTQPHILSLSLPRDHQLSTFTPNSPTRNGINGLRQLKRSMSGVFTLNHLSNKKDAKRKESFKEDESNWFFSRSAPNSLNESSLGIPDNCFPHIASNSRLMYLPDVATIEENKHPTTVLSKSCEEIHAPESLTDMKNDFDLIWQPHVVPKKQKKFTFQSTVRQIERRRMAEKLSKEAEKKEKQRLRELEAMQQVEEEFQKKRAKEKANIRQQLRLYAMNDNKWASLPPEVKPEQRQEPDGALSSSTSSSPQLTKTQEIFKKLEQTETKTQITKELSEFRQSHRNYKEYRGYTKFTSDSRHLKPTTVHPKVTCNMPKAKGTNIGNGNYRKDFVYGLKSLSINLSEDFQNNSPKIYYNKYTPVTKF